MFGWCLWRQSKCEKHLCLAGEWVSLLRQTKDPTFGSGVASGGLPATTSASDSWSCNKQLWKCWLSVTEVHLILTFLFLTFFSSILFVVMWKLVNGRFYCYGNQKGEHNFIWLLKYCLLKCNLTYLNASQDDWNGGMWISSKTSQNTNVFHMFVQCSQTYAIIQAMYKSLQWTFHW